MLGLSYDWDDGKDLKGRLSRGDHDLLEEAKKAGGLEELLKAWKDMKN